VTAKPASNPMVGERRDGMACFYYLLLLVAGCWWLVAGGW
jgi:hypothetical protein